MRLQVDLTAGDQETALTPGSLQQFPALRPFGQLDLITGLNGLGIMGRAEEPSDCWQVPQYP